ncbi:hypothetical protein [Tenacibaculum retecalamus]|uniref:hypothetical protein n=1 Tax=Tenacibaculum retecalamus TaxID=3018315 RepID=UPI0023D941DE|nr:hypothetical protein [Tenacibaculum retecalamus]WBX72086.1 hypothetical protein PG912_04790 [Tenacibaculum retecalamus]
MSVFNKITKDENVLVKVKVKSDIGFWQYQLFGILSLFMEKRNDYFIISDKRILLSIKEKIKVNVIFNDFSKIKINTKTDLLSFLNENNEMQQISLSSIKLEYEDYQYLKSKLNHSEKVINEQTR